MDADGQVGGRLPGLPGLPGLPRLPGSGARSRNNGVLPPWARIDSHMAKLLTRVFSKAHLQGGTHAAQGKGGAGRSAVQRMRDTMFMPAAEMPWKKQTPAPRSPPFRGFLAPVVEDTHFPPRIVPKEMRLPRLPDLDEGPAAILPRRPEEADAAPTAAMETLWIAAFLDASRPMAKRKSQGRFDPLQTDAHGAPGGSQRPQSARSMLAAIAEADGKASSEFQRLVKRLRQLQEDDRMRALGAAGASKPMSENPLMRENSRIRHVLLASRARGATDTPLKATAMDRLILVQRVETQAAIVLQRAYRRLLRRRFWKRFALENRAALKIQTVWYGHSERTRYLRYKALVTYLALRVQSWWRGWMTRQLVREDHVYYESAARDIQRAFRGHRARKTVRRLRHEANAVRIQAWWRGCKGRAIADRKFFDVMATRIQRLARGRLARKWYKRERLRLGASATCIQRAVRGWLGRRQRDEELWQRESNMRKHVVRILTTEDRWLQLEAARLKAKLEEMNSGVSLADRVDEWEKICQEILQLEQEYFMAMNDKEAMGVDVDEAWMVRFREDIARVRQAITTTKERALFEIALPVRSDNERRQRFEEKVTDIYHRLSSIQRQINEARGDTLRRDTAMARALENKRSKQRIAEEKRKWRIQAFTEAGKPDIRARRDAEVTDLRELMERRARAGKGPIILPHPGARGDLFLLMDAPLPGAVSTTLSLARASMPDMLASRVAETPAGHGPPRYPQSQFLLPDENVARAQKARLTDALQRQRQAAEHLRTQIAARMSEFDRKYGNIFGGEYDHSGAAPLDYDDIERGGKGGARANRLAIEDAPGGGGSQGPGVLVRTQEWYRRPASRLGADDDGAAKSGGIADAVGLGKKRDIRGGRKTLHDVATMYNPGRYGGRGADYEMEGDDGVRGRGRVSAAEYVLEMRKAYSDRVETVATGSTTPAPEADGPGGMTAGQYAAWMAGQAALDGAGGDADTRARHQSTAAKNALAAYGARYVRAAVEKTPMQAYEEEMASMIEADERDDRQGTGDAADAETTHHSQVAAKSTQLSSSLRAHAGNAPRQPPPVDDTEDAASNQAFARVNRLINALGVVSGEAEVLQYGALLKPAMDGMTRVMVNMMASDATAGAIDRVADKVAKREAEIRDEMKVKRELIREQRIATMQVQPPPTREEPPPPTPYGTGPDPPEPNVPPSTSHGLREEPSMGFTLPSIYLQRTFGPPQPSVASIGKPASRAGVASREKSGQPQPSISQAHRRFYQTFRQRAARVADDLAAISAETKAARVGSPSPPAPAPASTTGAATRSRGKTAAKKGSTAKRQGSPLRHQAAVVGFDLTQAAGSEPLEPTILDSAEAAAPPSPDADVPIHWMPTPSNIGARALLQPARQADSVPWQLLEELERERDTLLS